MELDKALEPVPEWYWIESGGLGRKIVEEIFPIKAGENVVVTADTISDWRAVQDTVKAIYALGAVPTLIVHPTTPVDTADPPAPVTAAVQACDAWIEFNNSYLLYSKAWREAMKAGVRFFALCGDLDGLIRMIGRVNYPVLDKFANKLVELSHKASEMHITSPSGTDVKVGTVTNAPGDFAHVLRGEGVISFEGPGLTQVPPGQASFKMVPQSAEGVVVFDASLYPPVELGTLREPVRLEISHGRITKVTGGQEARIFENWLASWDHPGIYEVAHCTYGFNPGIRRAKGDITHDERIWGGMEFGIGAAWAGAPAHCDGVVLHTSIWADDVQLEDEGRYVHPELAELARQLGVEGY
jgi:leucyl aminopeptidase (aminopeptidase T)